MQGHSTGRAGLDLANIQNFKGIIYQNQPRIFLRNEPEVHYGPQVLFIVHKTPTRLLSSAADKFGQKIQHCVKCIPVVL